MSESIVFEIPRVPPSLANQRLWWTKRYQLLREWKEEAWIRAQMARNERRLPLPHSTDPMRQVAITMHRRRLLDPDNATAAVKGIVDGLKGVLIQDDSSRYLTLAVHQVGVRKIEEERCVISVQLPAVPNRPAEKAVRR